MISFAHGSLGYLCNYTEGDFENVLGSVLTKDATIVTDDRLRLEVSIPNNPERDIYKGNLMTPTAKMNINGYHVLNEVLVDRGPLPNAI